MSRHPSQGPLLYAPLCLSVLLAALSFWFNSPSTTNSKPNDLQSLKSPSVAPPSPSASPEAGAGRLQELVSLLRAREPGDADALQALETLAADPAQAVPIGRSLMQTVPERASETGIVLLGALLRGGRHSEALELAQAGPESDRTAWLELVLSHWARTEPDAGATIADQLRRNGVSAGSFELVAKNWAAAVPEEVARYALSLPQGEYRSIALGSALEPWLLQDPAAVAASLGQLTEPFERDSVAASLAVRTDAVLRPTAQALLWAGMISDPALRRDTLSRLIREWSANDLVSASSYLFASPDFNPAQRQALLASLAPTAEPF